MGPSFKFKALDVSRKDSMDMSLCRGEGVKSKEVVSHTQLVSDHQLNPMVRINPEASSNGSFARDGTHSRSPKIPRTKKLDGAKSTSSFKRTSSGSSKISPSLKALSSATENGSFSNIISKPSKQRMGNEIQESGNSNSRGNHCANQSIPDGPAGWKRGGTKSSLEKFVSLDNNEFQKWGFGAESSSLEHNPKSLVEIHHRHAIDNEGGSHDVERAKKAIGGTALERIGMAGAREEGHRLQGDGLGAHGQLPNVEAVPDSNPSAEIRSPHLLQGRNSWDSEIHDCMEAGLDGIKGAIEEDGMEHDGRCCNEA